MADLIERVAALTNETTEGQPVAWYREKFGQDPDYSALLEAIAATPAERQQILRAYFEPTEQERADGLKVPTAAHSAIAELVRDGYVRVIVTTNFDRLLEQSIQAAGVAPSVVSTADAAAGALPLAHSPCTILKIHGDYLDTRILNTPSELAAYPEAINRLLDQMLDSYGLIVSGWSGEWDVALGDALMRCPTRRFTTYWTTRSPLGERAQDLAKQRSAVQIDVASADEFFAGLVERVRSLTDLDAPHPLTGRLAVATLKRYLADDRHRIQLHDLLQDQADHVVAETTVEHFPYNGVPGTQEEMARRLERYESICDSLMQVMVTGAYWANAGQVPALVRVLERVGDRFADLPGENAWTRLLWYPATLAMYTGGMGALAAGNLTTLAHLLGDVRVGNHGSRLPLLDRAAPVIAVDRDVLSPRTPQGGYAFTPVSDRMHDTLRGVVRDQYPNDDQYSNTFDRLEYLIAIAFIRLDERRSGTWTPFGRFYWRDERNFGMGRSFYESVEDEARAGGDGWAFLQTPMFNGSLEAFFEAKQKADEFIARLPRF